MVRTLKGVNTLSLSFDLLAICYPQSHKDNLGATVRLIMSNYSRTKAASSAAFPKANWGLGTRESEKRERGMMGTSVERTFLRPRFP